MSLPANPDAASSPCAGDWPALRPSQGPELVARLPRRGALPVIVLTEADQPADPGSSAAEVARPAPGVQIITTSAVTRQGLDVLAAALTGTAVCSSTSRGCAGSASSAARLRARHGDREKALTRSLRETHAFRDRRRRS
ncbi:hypothetical protein FE391_07110 [Nonomuraea sp. KC401]|uniref:hypothetical protein n=1 Tax=unclassified Nonomuraea TaxID=2593643 RepID=UPI0010FD8312|nr:MULTISPECIES: hypothetical protein [unclassified Nonomuraea]NBE93808.1 hypothetical protein [Nonomuraea sp. K271]TLF80686.1 hypothetical protein FE391_07110 [Nonomuraea sp. KC401]